MAKNDKLGIDKIINRINQEFEKTSSQVEKLVSDAQKHFDSLQGQIQDPIKKLMEDIDAIRERETKRFHSEFDRRVEELSELQNNLLEKIGVSDKLRKKPAAKKHSSKNTQKAKQQPSRSAKTTIDSRSRSSRPAKKKSRRR